MTLLERAWAWWRKAAPALYTCLERRYASNVVAFERLP